MKTPEHYKIPIYNRIERLLMEAREELKTDLEHQVITQETFESVDLEFEKGLQAAREVLEQYYPIEIP